MNARLPAGLATGQVHVVTRRSAGPWLCENTNGTPSLVRIVVVGAIEEVGHRRIVGERRAAGVTQVVAERSRSPMKPARAPSSREKSSLTITMRASICTWRIGMSSVPTRRRMSSRRSAESCSSRVLVRSSTETVPRLDSRPAVATLCLDQRGEIGGLRIVDLQVFGAQRSEVLHVLARAPARLFRETRVLPSAPR